MNKISTSFIKIIQFQQNSCSSLVRLNRFLSYKSDLSLDKIYPNSKQQLFNPKPPPSLTTEGKFSGYIPIESLEISYSRSSGPGGQNVNCVNSKVDVRFKIETANWLSDKVKEKLFEKEKTKINKEGFLIIKSEATRSQSMNLADAMDKLRCLIREMEFEKPPPSEETIEIRRKRIEKASRERLIEKRQRSQIKADRQAPSVNV